MSAFDLKLIHEFRQSPALYDRNNAKFRDKVFVARNWINIARKLRYDANILKDRMYQLRSRYNLEKRKMQSLRDEGVLNPKPMWPLYHNLNFLSNHIRQRKSYKMMRTVRGETAFRGFTKKEGHPRVVRTVLLNPIVEIKEELDDPLFENVKETVGVDASTTTGDTMNVSDNQQHKIRDKTSQTLRNITRLKQSLLADDDNNCSGKSPQKDIPKDHRPSHKFEAFGAFMSNSLQDLPEHKALAMIDSFTSQIVRSLIENRPETSNS